MIPSLDAAGGSEGAAVGSDVQGYCDRIDAEEEFDGQQFAGARALRKPSTKEVEEHTI